MGCSQNLIYTPSNPRHPYRSPGVHMCPHRTPGVPVELKVSGANHMRSIASQASLLNPRHLERTTCVPIDPQASPSIPRCLEVTSSVWNGQSIPPTSLLHIHETSNNSKCHNSKRPQASSTWYRTHYL
ncbi:hypothetical protein BV22DRAFT_1041188 [Leucogyrophana mollusca]|uniref:Uncharacterized protein n=1 Tax=Leucogyrophana mollusca TaxID=85980 RepID=A0ACB8B0Q7_9AGAM|nr:hypothetical protein BV22DRAFT_1041188 [Leucogyrophana mollusca]